MPRSPDRAPPLVSVIAPAYYSYSTLEACLEGLRQQTFQDFETIVVNSSPEDQTARLVAQRFPDVHFEQSPRRLLPHAARNRGVDLACGRWLAFTDPDCVPETGWLNALVDAGRRGHGVVVGAMGLAGDSAYQRAVHLCKFAAWLPGSSEGWRTIAPTANALYTREAWEAVGPFRGDSFSSDTLHSWHAAAKGFHPWFEPRAVVVHRHDGSMRSFLRERHSRGEDFARLRVAEEKRSKFWAALHLLALPAIPLLELARVGRRAIGSGWTQAFFWTAPLQLAANTAWALGEARTHARVILEPRTARASS
ncbi:MAG TPA: glycosyltransferase [Bryobacteraceae bacterium]|nr:glycosyltransferase [Bryobacteraceae bacterium]